MLAALALFPQSSIKMAPPRRSHRFAQYSIKRFRRCVVDLAHQSGYARHLVDRGKLAFQMGAGPYGEFIQPYTEPL
jgi:hypothetical protein